MGVLGTGVAAGVAQAGLQAQQVGRQQARRAHDRAYIQQRYQEIRAKRLKGLEEDDAAEAETSLHVDGILPDHQHQQDQPPRQQQHDHRDTTSYYSHYTDRSDITASPVTYGPPAPKAALAPLLARHHLDVKA